MQKILRRFLESDLAGALSLSLAATVALGLLLFGSPILAAQGKGTGTLPRVTVSTLADPTPPPPVDMMAIPSGHFEYVYKSGGGDVHVIVDQQVSEDDGHFAHRCHLKVEAFLAEFPRDP